MFQIFHLDVSKVDLEKARAAAATAPSWVTVPPWVTVRAYYCWWCYCVHPGA
jgi:hypothetical protein